jgi:hypothetical protein
MKYQALSKKSINGRTRATYGLFIFPDLDFYTI